MFASCQTATSPKLDAANQGVLFGSPCDQARLETFPGKPCIIQGLRAPYSKSLMVLSKLPEARYWLFLDQAINVLVEVLSMRSGFSVQALVDQTLTPPLPAIAIFSPLGRQAKSKTEELAKDRVAIIV